MAKDRVLSTPYTATASSKASASTTTTTSPTSAVATTTAVAKHKFSIFDLLPRDNFNEVRGVMLKRSPGKLLIVPSYLTAQLMMAIDEATTTYTESSTTITTSITTTVPGYTITEDSEFCASHFHSRGF
jgi:hypothetical protein